LQVWIVLIPPSAAGTLPGGVAMRAICRRQLPHAAAAGYPIGDLDQRQGRGWSCNLSAGVRLFGDQWPALDII